MLVRRELPEDVSTVLAVHTAAFRRPGQHHVPESRLVELLRADGDVVPALSLVATAGGEVVGHVVCSRATLAGGRSLGLGPLGVRPDWQRHGVGQALVHAVLGAADALDEPAVVLLGDPRYYARFGFVLAAPLGIVPPDPTWIGHFQVRPLTAWQPGTTGEFRYADAFSRL